MTTREDSEGAIQTAASPALRRQSAGRRSFRILVAAGPGAGDTFEISPSDPAGVLVGQSPSCSFRLADREVSRRHLSLELRDSNLRLRDLGSTNGTRVNGVSVVEAWLRGGEQVEIGGTTLKIEVREQDKETFLSAATSFGKVMGASTAMRRLYPLCERLAASSVPVIIEGETGTGKEVLAESIHLLGPRHEGPFIVFDCTAVPANLIEAALFGHERGAFTGAVEAREGVFEQAAGGTLLIDEIGDLDIELQAKLLRVLERGEVRRIGGKRWSQVDARVLVATRRDLDAMVGAGQFRDDLFYRIAVARIELPALRDREGDARLLATQFWRELAGSSHDIPASFLERVETYPWPGNVRELYNAVSRRVALGDLDESSESPRADDAQAESPEIAEDAIERILALGLPFPRARQRLVGEFERRYVERVLMEHGGHVGRAAAASGIALRYFQQVRARTKTPSK
jgi:two-component system, NtrC family, response regulator HydG